METAAPKLLLYGSCVSRDTASFMGDSVKLVSYIARQSLLSATGKPWKVPAEIGLDSPFQARSLRGDLTKDLFRRIHQYGPECDAVILDLIDERLGVYKSSDGRTATASHELATSNRIKDIRQSSEYLAFGTDSHFNQWRRSVWHLKQQLLSINKFSSTLVLAPAWAAADDAGEALPPWKSQEIHTVNASYERYYNYLYRAGFKTYFVAPERCVADAHHRWGRHPYHFAQTVYTEMSAAILGFTLGLGNSSKEDVE